MYFVETCHPDLTLESSVNNFKPPLLRVYVGQRPEMRVIFGHVTVGFHEVSLNHVRL